MTHRTDAEDYVLEAARKYARMKLFGTDIDENGNLCIYSHADRVSRTAYYADALLHKAERLINIMSLDEEDGNLVQ